MESITAKTNTLLKNCIRTVFPSVTDTKKFNLHRGCKTDYQFSQIHALARLVDLTSDDVAGKICEELAKDQMVETVEIVRAEKQVFVVFNINTGYLQDMISDFYAAALARGSVPPPDISALPKKILIDFSSPNIAKEMHVGHLRSTIIGESLCRVFEYCGCDVKRVNHIGDWGTQFGMLVAYIKRFNISDYDLPKLMQMYKEARKLFDSDTEFNKQAHIETVRLQQHVDDNIAIWKYICQVSMESFNKIYQQLQTHAEIKGESFYHDRMVELVDVLDNVTVKQDGMKLIFADGIDVPLILVKSDGGFTYDTSDLTAVHYRITEEKADKILYVVDAGQQQHFDLILRTARRLGWCTENQLVHVGFGVVLGADGKKLKTRSGETVRLQDLLDLANEHSYKITQELATERHVEWDNETVSTVARKIAINCVKYADLSNPRINNYKFTVEKMINLKGNTAVYLMYALARCKAIIRKIPNLQTVSTGPIILDNDDARNLAFKIARFPEVITDTVEQFCPHHLCNYLYDLVGLLTKFYDKNRCIEFDNQGAIIHIHEHRVCLINFVMMVISKLFDLIGLEQIEQI